MDRTFPVVLYFLCAYLGLGLGFVCSVKTMGAGIRRPPAHPGSKESSVEGEQESSEAEPSTPIAKRARPEPRTTAEQKKWADTVNKKGFRCERQVDVSSLDKNAQGIPQMRRRGLMYWFQPLLGYKPSLVKEFYRTMDPICSAENPSEDHIEASVGGRRILMTPDSITEYMNYTRPAPENLNYPFPDGIVISPALIRQAVYDDITQYTGENHLGFFKEDYRLVSKILHYNLFPRGAEHRPTDRSMELLYVFMSNLYNFDSASLIFYQMCDVVGDVSLKLRLPFPCLIARLIRSHGVHVMDREYVRGTPGPLNAASLARSIKLSWERAPQPVVPEDVVASPVIQLAAPPERVVPSFGTQLKGWLKQIFCQNVRIIKDIKKLEKERKRDRKAMDRMQHELSWHMQKEEGPSGEKYIAPPLEDSEEEAVEEEEIVLGDRQDGASWSGAPN